MYSTTGRPDDHSTVYSKSAMTHLLHIKHRSSLSLLLWLDLCSTAYLALWIISAQARTGRKNLKTNYLNICSLTNRKKTSKHYTPPHLCEIRVNINASSVIAGCCAFNVWKVAIQSANYMFAYARKRFIRPIYINSFIGTSHNLREVLILMVCPTIP
jgi:hypothetical protein